ncbi:MAG: DNA mismatch repair endonuclease MutL [Prevotella sp.]|jgi:DNA mismatch repair protein MutL|nr:MULTISPECIES: DNA mismatch repair endonuclease MutL [unclassified Prevotella]MCH3969923.1 DNA mismatch repair endonuclease MutL [Prevotella sp.]MCH4018397.1 DNA mismatch repair endonuclease MutL [Prevotella sp.]MCH4186070.1 DNA mismatch repair endonuclease MutL [Prevotella sp.]MCH4216361.1 DNA mismatch repair endonuclease MutL [Prevotella sp.]MCH4251106.1 DNA mismatch repair endonuclease MutL [Prevotella sp.]
MSDRIQLLPDSVANQIAAGEVIQRPASVIKELVENAVDAGAKTVHVVVVDAGRTSIQVIDDGCGMSETDARLAFERHATSKIRQAEDLFALHTMGFRGEALPSIAAVAQVKLKTRQAQDEIGSQLSISASEFVSEEPCSCPVGSNFKVENLFFNVPARRKFLKSNTTELNNIITAFERIVLVDPQITFTLHSNGAELFSLRPGNFRQRIVEVFGKRLNQDLLPLKVDTTLCKINGFVGKPESARKKGVKQFFFVNGRFMRHPYFHKAVLNAYERLIPSDEQIPYFLSFEVDPRNIDVNIHPTKTEIKFDNEQAIWQILSAAVRDAVGMFNDVPSIDFDTVGKPDIPVFNPDSNMVNPKVNYNSDYNPFNTMSSSGRATSNSSSQWGELYKGLGKEQGHPEEEIFPESKVSSSDRQSRITDEKSPAHYQYKGKYILTAVKSGLMFIDQHRAHVRILYEQYLQRLGQHKNHSQRVLFPEVVQIPASDQVMLKKVLPEMEELGFELSDLGKGSYAVNGVPEGLEGLDFSRLVSDMISSAIEKGSKVKEEMDRTLAVSLARHAAIPQGQVLNNDEMENIVNSLFACPHPKYTPDGKCIVGILPQQEIDHLLDESQ